MAISDTHLTIENKIMEVITAIGPWQIIIVFLSLGVIPTLIALIDILRNEFRGNNKLIWILVVLLVNIIGALLYFIIGGKDKLPKSKVLRS